MCHVCLELAKIFNKSIEKAKQVENIYWETRLKEKREWFLREIYEKDHNAAMNLFLKTKDDEITLDSEILDGKKWEDLLEEKFIAREKVPFPPPGDYDPVYPGRDTELEQVPELIDEIFSQNQEELNKAIQNVALYGNAHATVTWENDTIKIKAADCKDGLDAHDWMDYQGAGFKAPETICRKCGCPKVSKPAP